MIAQAVSALPPQRALRVVCADDHPGFLRSVVDTLEHAGMHVVAISSTGPGAIETIGALAPDVAVVDFRMPGLNGVDVALVARDRFPTTRIVILSGYDDPELIKLAIDAGAAAFVVKDCRPDELVGAVRRAAGGASS